MTIKPQNGTTSTTIKPLNTTEALLLTGNENITLAEFESTTKLESTAPVITTEKVATSSAMATNVLSSTVVATTIITVADTHEPLFNTTPHGLPTSDNHTASATALSDCKKGFHRNIKGNCELKLQNPSNM